MFVPFEAVWCSLTVGFEVFDRQFTQPYLAQTLGLKRALVDQHTTSHHRSTTNCHRNSFGHPNSCSFGRNCNLNSGCRPIDCIS